MERKLLYIVNPISGTKNKKSLQELIQEQTTKAGLAFEIFPSVANGDYSFLTEIIKDKKFTDIVIAGGDGTVNQAINSLKQHGLPFGIIPCGSGNGLAFSAGIPKKPVKALEVVFKGRPVSTDAFLVNERFACMLCGLGFDAQVALDFAKDRRRGLLTYIRKIVQNFFTMKAYPFTLSFGTQRLETEAYFISMANSNQFGNNFTIAPEASLTDGLLDIVIMTHKSKLAILLETLKQVTGFNKLQQVEEINEHANVVYLQIESMHISNPQLAPLHIDGEPVSSEEEIEVKILPKSFALIYPPTETKASARFEMPPC